MIPEEVLHIVENVINRESLYVYDLKTLRGEALKAIARYKDAKRKDQEFNDYLNKLKSFVNEYKTEGTKD